MVWQMRGTHTVGFPLDKLSFYQIYFLFQSVAEFHIPFGVSPDYPCFT